MKFTVAAFIALLLQPGPRPPLTPAQTLLPPALLASIDDAPASGAGADLVGTTPAAGDVLITCRQPRCDVANAASRKLAAVMAKEKLPPPSRSIRVLTTFDDGAARRARAVIHVADSAGPTRVVQGLWSSPSISDEVVSVFAGLPAVGYVDLGQPRIDPYGVSPTTLAVAGADADRAAGIVAAAAYFLATLPNDGAEALLSHLTVGAHARLAEDGRKAVAQMGNQQRASADVLIMFGQAIDREQRRMRSLERFMPEPVDPMLHSRILDIEKGITSVWTSMGITSSPYVPPAERIRGRGGEDRRVPSRTAAGPITAVEPPTAFLKSDSPATIVYELGNFIDGKRSISDIRDAVSAEFGSLPLPSVVDYFDRLAASGAITLK